MNARKGPLTDNLPSRGPQFGRTVSVGYRNLDVTLHAVNKFAPFGAVTAPEITELDRSATCWGCFPVVNIGLLQIT